MNVNALRRTGSVVGVAAVVAAMLGGTAASAAAAASRPDGRTLPPSVRAHLGDLRVPSAAEVRSVRTREAALAARDRAVPRFDASRAAVTTFTVNSSVDSPLAASGGTTCVDSESTPKCSLRAAVEAADNLAKPVDITLPAGTYELTSATALSVTDPKGLSITGAGAATTVIKGDGSGIITEAPTSSTAASPLLFLTHLRLIHGSDTDGGALYLTENSAGARAVLSHVVLTGNTASGAGGAVSAGTNNDGGTDSIYLTDCTVSGNHAQYGAGISEDYSYLGLVDDTITSNSTLAGEDGSGGGIASDGGVVDVTGGSVSDNTAGVSSYGGTGGGIYDDGETVITLTGVAVDGNTAMDGGAGGGIFAPFDQLDVTGGSISHDTVSGTDGAGGGVYVEYGAIVGLHGVTMTDDTTAGVAGFGDGGGAIFAFDGGAGMSITVDSHTVITGADNSAVFLFGFFGAPTFVLSDSTISSSIDVGDNASGDSDPSDLSGCGGAICANIYPGGDVTLTLTGDRIVGNSSNGSFAAGAVAVEGGYAGGGAVRLDGDTFRGNVGHGNQSSGAVRLISYSGDSADSTSLEATDTTFVNNRSVDGGLGGAIGAFTLGEYAPITMTFSRDHFTANSVGSKAQNESGSGGAIFDYESDTLTDHGSTFESNRAVGSEADGGAVYDQSYQSDRFDGTVFRGNVADGADTAGGAVYTESDAASVFDGATISGNAAQYGGGVFANSDTSEVVVTASTVSNNTARSEGTGQPGDGGAMYVDDGIVSATNSTFAGNAARSAGADKGQGGAVWTSGVSATFAYTTIAGNTAAQGAGIFADGNGGTLLGSIVAANHGPNCTTAAPSSRLSSLGGNVLGAAACVSAVLSTDRSRNHPGLGPLKFNGGPTKTMALSVSSPARGIGTFDCPSTDERGIARPATACDAGAYQLTFISPPAVGRLG